MSVLKVNVAPWSAALAIVALVVSMASCSKTEKPAETQTQTGPKTFASPEDAGKALAEATKADNREALLAIFGPESKDYI